MTDENTPSIADEGIDGYEPNVPARDGTGAIGQEDERPAMIRPVRIVVLMASVVLAILVAAVRPAGRERRIEPPF